MNQTHAKIIMISIVLFLVNLIQSGLMELSYDESYYWMYSRFLSWGYFDHPPMVALLIWAGEFLFGHHEVGVRLPFALMNAATFYLSARYLIGSSLNVFTMGWLSFALLSAGGFIALPDTPLLFFTALFWVLIKRYEESDNLINALMISLVVTALFYSKYFALLIVLFTTASYPVFLRRKSFWLVVVLTIVFYLPHIYWQWSHDFISFKFHLGGRVEKHFDIENVVNFAGTQLLLLGLFSFAPFVKHFRRDRFIFLNGLAFLAFLALLSLRNRVEGNWSVSVSLVFLIGMSRYYSELSNWMKKFVIVNLSFLLVLMVVLRFLILNPSLAHKVGLKRVNEVYGWKDHVIPKIKNIDALYATNYPYAAKASFYLNRLVPSLSLNSRQSQYDLLDFKRPRSGDVINLIHTNPRLEGDPQKLFDGFKDPVILYKDFIFREKK